MIKSSTTSCEMPPWVIFHIPHDSTVIPSEVRDQFVLNDKDLSREIITMTDHHTYDLIASISSTSQIVKFPVSRLVVDVERFESDCDEYMAARGMIEIRRDLYLDESTGLLSKSSTDVQERLKSAMLRWVGLSGDMVLPFAN